MAAESDICTANVSNKAIYGSSVRRLYSKNHQQANIWQLSQIFIQLTSPTRQYMAAESDIYTANITNNAIYGS